jgi:hypothetical protein
MNNIVKEAITLLNVLPAYCDFAFVTRRSGKGKASFLIDAHHHTTGEPIEWSLSDKLHDMLKVYMYSISVYGSEAEPARVVANVCGFCVEQMRELFRYGSFAWTSNARHDNHIEHRYFAYILKWKQLKFMLCCVLLDIQQNEGVAV